MAVKTISIDAETYKRLKTLKRDKETLSQTIKRIAPPQVDLVELFKSFDKDPVDPEFARAIDQQVSNRRQPSRRKR
jgi:predicted CopG family antitoxin